MYFLCLALVEKKLWRHQAQSHPPLSKDKMAAGVAIAPHKMSTMVTCLHCKITASTDTTKVQLASYNFALLHARSLFSLLLQMWPLPAEGEAGPALPFRAPLIILPQGQCEEERSQAPSLTGTFPHCEGNLVSYGRLKDYNS